MDFLPPDLSEYVEKHTSAEPSLLQEINRMTNEKMAMPRMLSGHLQGRILAMFSKMMQPNRILEIGTFTGYSALCLAEGLADDGEIITIDNNEELEDEIKNIFSKSNAGSRIELVIGNALEIIPEIQGSFDLVFIDADKENYLSYFELVFDKVRPGGIIIADNVLWSGKVIDDFAKNDRETESLRSFNQQIQHDQRVENVLFPVRDGLMIVRKNV